MAIETICKGCARKLRVDDEFAGRKARCPHCKTIYTVRASGAASDMSPESGESDRSGWLLRTKDGAVFGPVSKSELDSWAREGRLDVASQIRQENAVEWRQATELYPSLKPEAAANANPFTHAPTESAPAANPYSTPRAAGRLVRRLRPHRGGLILAFSLAGFICCPLFSVAAWVMGQTDLREISMGGMDPEGRGLTQAGMIIGIVGTVLMILSVVVQMIGVAFLIANG